MLFRSVNIIEQNLISFVILNINETNRSYQRLISMTIKPLYRSENKLLVGLSKDFPELCVLDGLVVEIDLDNKKIVSSPAGGLQKLKKGSYIPIRQSEKREYCKLLAKRLKKKLIKKIEEDLESPPSDAIKTLVWIPDRLAGNGSNSE